MPDPSAAEPCAPASPLDTPPDIVYGEIIGADFTDRSDGRIVMHVAVNEDVRVGRQHVTIVRDPNAVVMTSDEASMDRAHWWNQGAKAELRRMQAESGHAGAPSVNEEESGHVHG